MQRAQPSFKFLIALFLSGLSVATATPVSFDIPVQSAPAALRLFIQQSGQKIMFDANELKTISSQELKAAMEPADALGHLLAGSGFRAQRAGDGGFVIVKSDQPVVTTGVLRGSVVKPQIGSSADIRILVRETGQLTLTDRRGDFVLNNLQAGTYTLIATAEGLQPMHITDVRVRAGRELVLSRETMRAARDVTELEPFVVRGRADEVTELEKYIVEGQRHKPVAAGNIDLPRTENDALPYQVFTRSDIQRSGLLDLNEYMRRELLETDPSTLSVDQQAVGAVGLTSYAGSNTLAMRGYSSGQTIVLVNGRRMIGSTTGGSSGPADMSAIPMSMIERVEVLPASASAIYGANAVAGVINIVLRPNFQATEITTSYNNAFGFDAAQTAVLLSHGQTLLDGKLDLKIGASFRKIDPPQESELGYLKAATRRTNLESPPSLTTGVFAATPNIRSTDGSPLFGPNTASFTLVNAGANGLGGLAAFAGREGVRNFDFFTSPLGFGYSGGAGAGYILNDGTVYGRHSEQTNVSGNAVYRPLPWLELAVDVLHSRTEYSLGASMSYNTLNVPANSPFNPFGKAVTVTWIDTLSAPGAEFDGGERFTNSATLGFLFKMPREWRLSLDGQYSESKSEYTSRSWNSVRLQELVAAGNYNPFRDTQAYLPPQEFYDYAVTRSSFDKPYRGTTSQMDLRLTNYQLPLPTGMGSLVLGGNFQRINNDTYAYTYRYSDGTPASSYDSAPYAGVRTNNNWGVFGELQAPLLPKVWLPGFIRNFSGDLAWRYAGSDTFKKSANPPTLGFKVDFKGGFSLRSTYTTAYVPPTPLMSVPIEEGIPAAVNITDPRRNETYSTLQLSSPNPDLVPERATTRTYGFVFQKGTRHQVRLSVDFVDTTKVDELTTLSAANLILLEEYFPDRVQRETLQPGDPASVGRVTMLRTGYTNIRGRHSKNWTGSARYAFTDLFGGVFQANVRGAWFESFQTQARPDSPVVENIDNPDAAFQFLKYRASFNAGWSNNVYGFGMDGRYYHSRILSRAQALTQGSDRVDRYWEFDAYLQADLTKFIPWKERRMSLRGQFRVNNVFGAEFPFYNSSAYDVQPYGDWRGRMYSASITASF